MRLNIGCGFKPQPGYVNTDLAAAQGVDLVFDLGGPWPLPTSSVDEIRAWHVLEHVPALWVALNEAYRVLRPGGHIWGQVPYGLRALYTVSHVHAFDMRTFHEMADQFSPHLQRTVRWHIQRLEYSFQIPFFWHLERYAPRVLRAVTWLDNHWHVRFPFQVGSSLNFDLVKPESVT